METRSRIPAQSASGFRTEGGLTFKNLVALIFKCWHRNLSLPFTTDGETYRVCLGCGARRRFMPDRWRSVGAYYREKMPIAQAVRRAAYNGERG